ncbi:Permeases of the major facilitator superfamily, partial [hydrothermal vent metagenome]
MVAKTSVNKDRYSHGVAIVLVCLGANILSHADRNMLVVMIDVVQSDLGLSDTQIGLLHGLAFSLSFSVFTIVFASLADRMARGNLIAIAICLWSIATGLFGFATGFLSMFLARMGVGLGQAMLSPTVYSLLASNFPRSRLARASSWYVSGSFLGVALVLSVGGYLAEMSGQNMSVSIPYIASFPAWRAGFIGAGIIGLIFAISVPFVIKDQRRVYVQPSPSFGKVLQFVMEHRNAIARHFVGFSFCALAMFTLIAWGPSYFMRVQGVGAATAGVTLALGFLISNISGVLISGVMTDYLERSGIPGGPFIVGSCAAFLTAISMVFFVLGGDGSGSAIAFFLGLHFSCYVIAPSATAIQVLSPERMRARMYALFLCLNNLIGMSIGALVVGLFNDYVFRSPSAVGISMAITVSVA